MKTRQHGPVDAATTATNAVKLWRAQMVVAMLMQQTQSATLSVVNADISGNDTARDPPCGVVFVS